LDTRKEISRIRDSYIPTERIKKRAQYEDEAKNLLVAKMPNLTWNLIDSVISTMDSDFWQGEQTDGRFYPLFGKPNRNRIKTNDLKHLEEFLTAVIRKDISQIDVVISNLNGISYGATSLFFYIMDRDRYNVFIPITVKGLRIVYPEEAKGLVYNRPFEKNYLLFNDLCNRLKNEFSVQPQELDILLTVLGKQAHVRTEGKKEPVHLQTVKPIVISSHVEAEAILLEIGNLLGFETYTADPAKVFENKKLGVIASAEEVPEILRGTKNVERTDVIWYKEDSPPNYFFEVEHGGTMRDALHRLYQARHLNARFFVVGPEENRQKFEEWVSTSPYNTSRKLYTFKTFEELSKLYGLIKSAENFKKEFGIM
jgi:hypothetical protein